MRDRELAAESEFRLWTELDLPHVTFGADAVIFAKELHIGQNVSIGAGTVVVADSLEIGSGVQIGALCDLRAGSLSVATNSEIGRACKVLVADEFRIGRASRISWDARIVCRSFVAGDFLYFAQDCSVGYGGTQESTALIRLGNNVALGPHTILNANCRIELEDNVGSGSYVSLWTHGYHFGHSVLDGFAASFKPILVRRNVWLGYHVTVLPGVTIGENSIIAAGSVVARSIERDVLAGGVPCRVLKPISSVVLNPDDALRVVEEILDSWACELRWKGFEVEALECSQGSAKSFLVRDADEAPLKVLLLNSQHASLVDGDIIVSVEDLPEEVTRQIPSSVCLFQLRSRKLLGVSTPLSEDLRDHLRRHTIPCGTETVWSCLPAKRFARLRNFNPKIRRAHA